MLRNRLKKDKVNLLKWKNRKLIETSLLLIFFGVLCATIAEGTNNQLVEPYGSSGDSAYYEQAKSILGSEIDNYANVMNYEYNTKTSTKSKQRNVCLKDLDFSFCENIDIPGMPDTKEDDFLNQYIFSTAQCPQGICITEEFVFITSYSAEEDCLGALMIFDKESGEYLITLGMDKDSHLGGIAYDGENIWVCNSKNKTVERISYDFIALMATQNKGEVVDATNLVDAYKIKNTPSCITFYNGRLWVGTHNVWMNSHMVAYYYNRNDDKLKDLSTYNIPSQVQGIAFGEDGEVYLSTSYGRQFSSYIKKYESVFAMTEKVDEPSLTIEMPPCSEEIAVYDRMLYVLFESAGEKYLEGTDGNGKSLSPLDKILLIPLA